MINCSWIVSYLLQLLGGKKEGEGRADDEVRQAGERHKRLELVQDLVENVTFLIQPLH